MTTDTEQQRRWREISRHLDEAMELGEEARRDWLLDLDQRAPTVASAVRALLSEREHLADQPLLNDDPLAGLSRAGLAGQRLGAYTLESVLGHGGMGTVWLARRSDGRFEGHAAVKLLNAALLGRPSEQRFVREGSVLAKLRHPNIAQLVDAGVSPGGQPYLVLEYVAGERLDAYAERRGLDIEARVRLFLDVLAAVTHAHSHLVVHRDLKPSNIYVTGDGIVKLLDFGVAALLADADGRTDSQLTRESGTGLTPEYAAPEQLLGNPVSTATDVYALGLVLFVLLVGRHPLGAVGTSATQLARATLEKEPPRPSQAAADAVRGRVLRGDLDNIVAKALKKEPSERYGSAELLAQDLRRYLAHEPVTARPDTLVYRTGKFVRRHRGGVAVGLIVAVVLIAATVITTLQMLEAQRQRDAAVFQSKRAEYQTRFAYQIMSEVGGDGQPITIRALMQKGIDVLEKNYGDDPEFVISALINISGRYMDLGDTNGEYDALLRAERVARKLGDPAEIASVQCNTVETELNRGHPQKAVQRLRDGLAQLAKLPKPTLGGRIECGTAQARLLWSQNKLDDGAAVAKDVALLMEENDMQADVRYNSAVSMLEIMLADSGHTGEALSWNRRATAALRRSGRGGTMSMNANRHNEASYLSSLGDVRSAYATEKDVLNEIVAQEGIDSVPSSVSQRLGFLQVRIEETAAGLVWIDRAVASAVAQNHRPAQIGAILSRARALLVLGRFEPVPPQVQEAERLAREDPEANAMALLSIRQIRAQLQLEQHHPEVAVAEIEPLLTELGYPQKRTSDRLAPALTARARAELMMGRPAKALATARESLAVADSIAWKPDQSAESGAALQVMAECQRAMGDVPGARASATRAATVLANSLGPNHSETRAAAAFAASL
jgi:eukaryotic-like serine/threonine-protein kinase